MNEDEFDHDADLDISQSDDPSVVNKPTQEENSESTLAGRETRKMRKIRIVFLTILVLTAAGIGYAIATITRNDEIDAFEAKFVDHATKVIDSFHSSAKLKLGALESLSIDATSYANFKNETWPFVTLPNFAHRGGVTRTLAHSVSVALYPRVPTSLRKDWEDYAIKNLERIDDALQFEQGRATRRSLSSSGAVQTRKLKSHQNTEEASKSVFTFEDGQKVATQGEGPFFPFWESSPVWTKLINFDLASSTLFASDLEAMLSSHNAIVGKAIDLAQDSTSGAFQAFTDYWAASESFLHADEPVSKILLPVFDRLSTSTKRKREPVGVLVAVLFWESYFYDVLPSGSSGITAVIMSDCDQVYTYRIEGTDVHFVGKGDHHDSRYNSLYEAAPLFEVVSVANSKFGFHLEDLCHYRMRIYPTVELEEEYITTKPWVLLGISLAVFAFVIIVTLIYDHIVDKRQQMVMAKAKQAGAIVSSIFPSAVRTKLYQGNADNPNSKGKGPFKAAVPSVVSSQQNRIKSFLDDKPTRPHEEATQLKAPSLENAIADTFPNVTIMFAEIVGFTSWSSQREPGEVFVLLQTVFRAFDANAKAMNVFKVETIGDCYVAATGLPEPQTDHAIRMARFANKCMMNMIKVTRELEVSLGPDTGDLRMRIGMHSGPVIAGVLQGAKARFQLFGDSMNMAARMEAHSLKNSIQCSGATAELLVSAGKEHWVRPRENLVQAKGKGDVQTYWVLPRIGGTATSIASSDHAGGSADQQPSAQPQNSKESWTNPKLVFDLSLPSNRYQRLIDWNVELLAGLLKQIAARRIDLKQKTNNNTAAPAMQLQGGSTALDEVTEIIKLPQFDGKAHKNKTRPDDIVLEDAVITQLRDYVMTTASMYRDNAFHNFEHASHVTMSTNKLLKRVVVRDADDQSEASAMDLHYYTYGITSDPITQFTLVFCALIHDVDHEGVSNFQLVQEQNIIAKRYNNKSIAEQNSVDLAWDLLMDPIYADLQKAIYANDEELKRFRQLVVNIVLATDIFDKDMKKIREKRWDKAFQNADEEEEQEKLASGSGSPSNQYTDQQAQEPLSTSKHERKPELPALLKGIDGINLRATIVMEHLIQASDVAHTMQHYDIYLKWNERLFNEMYSAYEAGRAGTDPSLGWYKGEIRFFDKYIIPLAQKLEVCGVFGVSSDEYMNYALSNRKMWAIQGDQMVQDFLQRIRNKKAGKNGRRTRAPRRESAVG